ncbi:MAG: DUF6159 family protein [Acidimicrobiaceae bacterium]|nr:DUF6159 family protein [Acidimicrobiaceae bacterium]
MRFGLGYRRGLLTNSFKMFGCSWAILRKDREILFISAFQMLFTGVVLVGLLVAGLYIDKNNDDNRPISEISVDQSDAQISQSDATTNEEGGNVSAATDGSTVSSTFYIYSALILFVLMFTAQLAQGAIVAAAYERMAGGDPTVRSALRATMPTLIAIASWALIKTVVHVFVAVVRSSIRKSRGPDFVSRFGETAWKFASYLTVPAIVIDRQGPIKALKQSLYLLRHTWGENLAGNVGLGLLGFLCMLPGFATVPLATRIAGTPDEISRDAITNWLADNPAAIFSSLIIVAGVVWILFVRMLFHTLSNIFKTALYVYATTDSNIAGFNNTDLQKAFAAKGIY